MNSVVPNKKIYAIVLCYNAAPVLKEFYERIDKKISRSIPNRLKYFDEQNYDVYPLVSK